MTSAKIQVYGQRCSGTNALIALIEKNFGQGRFTEQFGFKHWFVPESVYFPNWVTIVVIARDVIQWAQSFYKNPWHAHPQLKALPFDQFIRHEWCSIWDTDFWDIDSSHPIFAKEMMHERCPITGDRFKNIIQMRTAKLKHWSMLDQRCDKLILCSHDEFQNNVTAILDKIGTVSGIKPLSRYTQIMGYKGDDHIAYQPASYPNLSVENLRHIDQFLDWKIEEKFGLLKKA